MVLRRLLIFSFRTLRVNSSCPAKAFLPGCASASSTSCFNILPPAPVAEMEEGSIFLSAIIAEATGVALTSFGTAVTGACDTGACTTGGGVAAFTSVLGVSD